MHLLFAGENGYYHGESFLAIERRKCEHLYATTTVYNVLEQCHIRC